MRQGDVGSRVAALQDALNNLYNPLYSAPDWFCADLGCDAAGIPNTLIAAIHALAPDHSVPADAPIRRYHLLLHLRYIDGLTQEAAAERMGISARYLRDLQRLAVQALASRLFEGGGATSSATDRDARSSQVAREIAALERTAPHHVAMLGEAARSAIALARLLESMRGIDVDVSSIPSDMGVSMHPSALKQVLLKGIEGLAHCMTSGRITIVPEGEGTRPDGLLWVCLTGAPTDEDKVCDTAMIDEIVASHGGEVRVERHASETAVWLGLPSASSRKMLVLVVDDNSDLVAFYRAYVMGTAYELAHVTEGSAVLPFVERNRPDLIVLDVMLPDADLDGWELLIQLHDHPSTSGIPVVVCSVIRDRELALALGASEYVPKPVGRQAFLAALDRAAARAQPTAPPHPSGS